VALSKYLTPADADRDDFSAERQPEPNTDTAPVRACA